MSKRIINLGGGSYHANVEGNYIQGQTEKKQPQKAEKSAQPNKADTDEVINTNGANYVESLGGIVVDCDVIAE